MKKTLSRLIWQTAIIAVLFLGVQASNLAYGQDGDIADSNSVFVLKPLKTKTAGKTKAKSATARSKNSAVGKRRNSGKTKNQPEEPVGEFVSGKSLNIVQPPYPPAARAVKASGRVDVQVLIDENGNVLSAEAANGHALLKAAAVSAARASKFTPSTLDGKPVKVSGVITYNFTQ